MREEQVKTVLVQAYGALREMSSEYDQNEELVENLENVIVGILTNKIMILIANEEGEEQT